MGHIVRPMALFRHCCVPSEMSVVTASGRPKGSVECVAPRASRVYAAGRRQPARADRCAEAGQAIDGPPWVPLTRV
ncbi:hypothetical protein GCM10010464_67550 [Pseudonocardia yunnanensis]